MIAEGTLKMALLGAVGSTGVILGSVRNYVGHSWKAISSTGRINWKLGGCTIYKASGFNFEFTNERAAIREITYIGDAESFLQEIKGERLFKKAVSDRCVELFNKKLPRKNIYVWRGSSTEFKEGDEKWYYTPSLQHTDWLQKGLDLLKQEHEKANQQSK
ncbi:hypothetical protein MHC_01540 [Mycoplasma haemocanis str. Illinois]|uniref:Uncharacterized protein n=1 Tax=Mycoplasma haemocanis (strain Illinois) TaxID=1111676 RepID=H6N6A2_MYCHN|nr:hypothetical protein [Mycoplasma haemocanis]AEW45174.1 hypothetical protein MHC_01540 [Mycoplasma haemocanis str. Illinois]